MKVTVDGNEGNGRLALNTGGDRPQIDATLDFGSLNLGPYIDSTRAADPWASTCPSGYLVGLSISSYTGA